MLGAIGPIGKTGRNTQQNYNFRSIDQVYGAVNRALSTWKEITAPRKVERAGIPASGV